MSTPMVTSTIATINPATGEKLQTFTAISDQVIEEKLALAMETFQTYRRTSFAQRKTWMFQVADILEARATELGKMITLEMGKTLKSAIAEVEKCALVCRFYGEKAEEFLADLPGELDSGKAFVRYQPLGPILAVMPWNFPFWQVFRFAAPALMAGNVGLLKHASNVPQCALAIEQIFLEGGFPAGAFQTLLVGADRVAQIISDKRVMAATLTGSEPAGASLASLAGKYLKKTVLELGGSDPFIVLPSADLDLAATTAVAARLMNSGQSCVAAKRFILFEAIADDFLNRLLAKFSVLKVGDPMLPDTDVGPLATPAILHDLDQQVQACLNQGAKALIGGKPLDRPGNFYPPTILADLPPGCPAYQEEFFGPVALIFRVNTLDEAIALANSTDFGLGASAWTNEPPEKERLVEEIEAGAVFINALVKSDPRLPFGGIKRSGYGRELSFQGMYEFVNQKTVWIN
ncbi:MAG: NAD-dependent succinate-semialdehyde dehydrogenase [Microcoleaceae cyanobacterium]